ncbi:MAG: hypothetical protein K1Y36_20645 [Blastocatellia bacterium]|nr:hypothetical protein [Blastocatellia bacterium]
MEYAIQFSCPVRRTVNEKRLRELGRLGHLTSRLIFASIESQSGPSPNALRFLEKYAEPLAEIERIAPVCRACPACLPTQDHDHIRESVGCLGRLNYPIDAHFEHFLANRTQLLLDVLPTEEWPRLLHVLLDPDNPFDGERSKLLRRMVTSNGQRYFERSLPLTLKGPHHHLTTDHLFDVIQGFQVEATEPEYERELPPAALSDYNEFFTFVLRHDLLPTERFRMQRRSRSFNEFVRLGAAIAKAEELHARILME